MLDYRWPPLPTPVRPGRRRPSRAPRAVNLLRQSRNYRLLDGALILTRKLGHDIRSWHWTSANTADGACADCGALLVLDANALPGLETLGSTALESPCPVG